MKHKSHIEWATQRRVHWATNKCTLLITYRSIKITIYCLAMVSHRAQKLPINRQEASLLLIARWKFSDFPRAQRHGRLNLHAAARSRSHSHKLNQISACRRTHFKSCAVETRAPDDLLKERKSSQGAQFAPCRRERERERDWQARFTTRSPHNWAEMMQRTGVGNGNTKSKKQLSASQPHVRKRAAKLMAPWCMLECLGQRSPSCNSHWPIKRQLPPIVWFFDAIALILFV